MGERLRILLARHAGVRILGYRRGYFSDSKTRHRKVFRILPKVKQFTFSGAQLKNTAYYAVFFNCAPGRIRTCDRLVKSELLYQLSYEGIIFFSTHRHRRSIA